MSDHGEGMLAFLENLPHTNGSVDDRPIHYQPVTPGPGSRSAHQPRNRMLSSFLRGYSWEPSPVLDRAHRNNGLTDVADLRAAADPAESVVEEAPEVSAVEEAGAHSRDHLHRYLEALREHRQTESAPVTPESLYFVDGVDEALREVVGFRMRGHGRALMGAFILPRHHRSAVPNGRPSLASFLSKPPRQIGYAVDPAAPGHITLFMPGITESIPGFMDRLREDGGSAINVDSAVIDIAFDLRLSNPSEIRTHSHGVARPVRSVFRTIGGHVLSGVSVGLNQTLHKDDRFIALAAAVQHRPSGDIPLPTLAVNRSILALQSPLSDGDLDDAVRSTLAFHPDTASDEHILGPCYEGLGE